MALVTCGLTAKVRYQLQNPTLILSMGLPFTIGWLLVGWACNVGSSCVSVVNTMDCHRLYPSAISAITCINHWCVRSGIMPHCSCVSDKISIYMQAHSRLQAIMWWKHRMWHMCKFCLKLMYVYLVCISRSTTVCSFI